MSITMTAHQLAPSNVAAQALARAAEASSVECSCKNDGLLAFALPWLAVTTLGTIATYNQSDCAFVLEAVVPGLLAGATGLLMYRLTKRTVKQLRRHWAQVSA